MNKELIEKWKKGEIAIDLLINDNNSRANTLFSNLKIDIKLPTISRYVYIVSEVCYNDNTLPEGMTAVPLEDFFKEGNNPDVAELLKQVTDENGEFLDYCLENKEKLILLRDIENKVIELGGPSKYEIVFRLHQKWRMEHGLIKLKFKHILIDELYELFKDRLHLLNQ